MASRIFQRLIKIGLTNRIFKPLRLIAQPKTVDLSAVTKAFSIQLEKKPNNMEDYQFSKVISFIKSVYQGVERPLKKYELFRYRLHPKGVIIIYRDNRLLRTRVQWPEPRIFKLLAKRYGPIKQGVFFKMGRYQTEVDGVIEEDKILVEVKRHKINQECVDFYEKKRIKLGFEQLLLIAFDLEDELKISPSLQLGKFIPDWEAVRTYYKAFAFPPWIREKVSHRHFRFLLPTGAWKAAKKLLTSTPKHSIESKFRLCIKWLRYWYPIKIYYSMSRMVNPPADYFARGYPLPNTLAVFDIDGDCRSHTIGESGYCERCLSEATEKRKLAEEILMNEGYEVKSVFSGSKGYHLYIMEHNAVKEVNPTDILQLGQKLGELSDTASFRNKLGCFDVHRIIKVPGTIDCSTGIIVNERLKRVILKDQILFL